MSPKFLETAYIESIVMLRHIYFMFIWTRDFLFYFILLLLFCWVKNARIGINIRPRGRPKCQIQKNKQPPSLSSWAQPTSIWAGGLAHNGIFCSARHRHRLLILCKIRVCNLFIVVPPIVLKNSIFREWRRTRNAARITTTTETRREWWWRRRFSPMRNPTTVTTTLLS